MKREIIVQKGEIHWEMIKEVRAEVEKTGNWKRKSKLKWRGEEGKRQGAKSQRYWLKEVEDGGKESDRKKIR